MAARMPFLLEKAACIFYDASRHASNPLMAGAAPSLAATPLKPQHPFAVGVPRIKPLHSLVHHLRCQCCFSQLGLDGDHWLDVLDDSRSRLRITPCMPSDEPGPASGLASGRLEQGQRPILNPLKGSGCTMTNNGHQCRPPHATRAVLLTSLSSSYCGAEQLRHTVWGPGG